MEHHSKEKVIDIEIYTDGACKNIGITNHTFDKTFGGWSFVVVKDNNIIYETCGGCRNTTNNIMEMTAIIEALKYVQTIRKKEERVMIYSDSAYVINCVNQGWWKNWQRNGWINSKKEEVKNRELWIKLIPYFDHFWYTFSKVKGHSGVIYNERCDELASNFANKLKADVAEKERMSYDE